MRAYVCVYRHSIPKRRYWKKTMAAAASDTVLAKFLEEYESAKCVYDWGDDPSFFASSELLGNARALSWGVCRRDVRSALQPGDFVVWFCAKQSPTNEQEWHYYYIGCSTVRNVISRGALWSDERFAAYRRFYNVLAKVDRGKLVQHESFHKFHKDWRNRASAPYVIFEPNRSLTAINVRNPVHVATKPSDSLLEVWRSTSRSREIKAAVFGRFGIQRSLRTRSLQRPHRHIALHKAARVKFETVDSVLERLRDDLLEMVS